ncbi:hypothetical protein QAD02_021440 [Eretmocerus hayati]|uniref:Uncharacterized protein n=1 Tax=Eretmocerus hayati TaxID=131215 RepID=A0ACC2PTF1_9HYME|nr:hypothetical protein QAD02_021440 [Eretmocerus hayati]
MVLELVEDPERSKYFHPCQCSSQPCESNFRITRSFHPTWCCKANCSGLEALRTTQRVELLTDLLGYDYSTCGEQMNFPRKNVLNSSSERIKESKLCVDIENDPLFKSSLTVSSIRKVMMKARRDALKTIHQLGVQYLNLKDCDKTHVTPADNLDDAELNADTISSGENSEEIPNGLDEAAEQCLDQDERTLSSDITGEWELRDYSAEQPVVTECCSYSEITDRDGGRRVVRRSTYLYSIIQGSEKLSSDRLIRVRQCNPKQSKHGAPQRTVILQVTGRLKAVEVVAQGIASKMMNIQQNEQERELEQFRLLVEKSLGFGVNMFLKNVLRYNNMTKRPLLLRYKDDGNRFVQSLQDEIRSGRYDRNVKKPNDPNFVSERAMDFYDCLNEKLPLDLSTFEFSMGQRDTLLSILDFACTEQNKRKVDWARAGSFSKKKMFGQVLCSSSSSRGLRP